MELSHSSGPEVIYPLINVEIVITNILYSVLVLRIVEEPRNTYRLLSVKLGRGK